MNESTNNEEPNDGEKLTELATKLNESSGRLSKTRQKLTDFYRDNNMITQEQLIAYLIDSLTYSINYGKYMEFDNKVRPRFPTDDFTEIINNLQRDTELINSLRRNEYPPGIQDYIQQLIQQLIVVTQAYIKTSQPEQHIIESVSTEIRALNYAKRQLVPSESS